MDEIEVPDGREHYWSPNKKITHVLIGSEVRGDINALTLEKKIQGVEVPGVSSLEESYTDYRLLYIAGLRDRYGRCGFIQNVPNQGDSAVSSVFADLENTGDKVLMRDRLFTVYDSQHSERKLPRTRKGRVTLPRLNKGTKIEVPLGQWAGHFAYVFIPDDPTAEKSLWYYSHEGRSVSENFKDETRQVFLQVLGGAFGKDKNGTAGAVIYSIRVAMKFFPSIIPEVREIMEEAIASIEDVGERNDGVREFLEKGHNYENDFEMSQTCFLKELAKLEEKFSRFSDWKKAFLCLAASGVHLFDPALTTEAIDKLTEPKNYREFILNTYNSLKEIESVIDQDRSEKTIKSATYATTKALMLSLIGIPWQMDYILGEANVFDLHKKIGAIDHDFKNQVEKPTAFTPYKIPLSCLPEEIELDERCIVDKNGYLLEERTEGLGLDEEFYFDMTRLMRNVLAKIKNGTESQRD